MSIGGFIRRKLYWTTDCLKGGIMKAHMDDLKYTLSDAESGKVRQQQHIDELLKHATTYSEYYKPYAGKPLSDFPIANKLSNITNYDRIRVPTQYIPFQIGDRVHVQKTSGSTGTPFAIHQDTRKRQRRVVALKYFADIVGFKSHESLVQCEIWIGTEKTPMQIFRENIYPIDILKMDDHTIEQMCTLTHKRKATALIMYAGWAEKFCEYLDAYPQNFKNLKVLISGAETLKSSVREKLRQQLNCAVVERYANEEQGVLGQQRADSTCFYLNHGNYFFEFLKMDSDEPAEYGELARVVVTDFFNYAFPMIRYDTGDAAIILPPDEYSNGYPVLGKLYGRRMDVTYDTSSKPIYPLAYLALEDCLDCLQWQIIQTSKLGFTVKINGSCDEEKVVNTMKQIVGQNAKVVIEKVEEIPVLSSGKRKLVLCEYTNT